MDRETIRKIKVVALGFICLCFAFGIGYSVGYAAGIDRAIEIGSKFFDFQLKPDWKILIKSYLAGT